MTPGARLLSIVEIIDNILTNKINNNYNIEINLTNWLRKNRYAGSKDKKEISNIIYGIFKRYFILNYIRSKYELFGNFSLEITIIYYIFHICKKDELINYFDDGPYAIKMNKKIKDFILKINNLDMSKDEYIKNSLPEWLFKKVYESYSTNYGKICESMFDEAHFDIRVKKGISRKIIINKFKDYQIKSEITPISPIGIRISKRTKVSHLKEFKNGLFEVQDEGSQLASLLCGVKEKETVIDLCSGAGGKSLAISDFVENIKIIATDIDANRLKRIKERAIRLKVKDKIIIEKDYNSIKLKADRIVCDVPCSGSGTWRRDPEGKWSITLRDYQKLLSLQENIIRTAAQLVQASGRLVYATCSILKDENKTQIQKFLANSNEWVIEKEELLMPNELGDGFYFTILKKINSAIKIK